MPLRHAQHCLNLRVTSNNLFVAEVVELERLGQSEDMFVLEVVGTCVGNSPF